MTPEEKAVERLNALLTGARNRKRQAELEIMQLEASIKNMNDTDLTREERVKVFEGHVDLLPFPQQIILHSYLGKVAREDK